MMSWWNSAPILSAAGSWAIWVALIFTTIGAVVGAGGSIASNRANDILTRQSNERIAAANLRAAQANERAEAAGLQAEQLRRRLAWRRLTAAARTVLVQNLKGFGHDVWIQHVDSDPEVANLAAELTAALGEAGVKRWYYSGWQRAVGLQVLSHDVATREHLATALFSAGLPPDFVGVPPQQMHGDLVILVGSKPDGLQISDDQ